MFLHRILFYALVIVFWAFCGAVHTGHSWAGTNVGVLYPAVNEPYRSIFQQILEGIESFSPAAKSYRLAQDFDRTQVKGWLGDEKIDAIIALGKPGFLAAEGAGESLPVITGALQFSPGGMSGISLDPDPALLFAHLKKLVPQASGIHVVYSENNRWMIKLAESSARSQGLKFFGYPVSDLREAARQYRELLKTLRGPSEAIWLPLDNITANEDVILPMVLQAAWDRNLVVFSSKPSHAQRGALFSLFPDHFALGKSLAKMASLADQPSAPQVVIPLADLKIAVNSRTASHLGLYFTPRQQKDFDLVFPSR